ncbi:ABC transporter related protein [alpha proteobacterium BAL199]|jgi:spermidine/putrescine transport system ATP-binding protein|nr:ABC transporter related protein [alpha proteobacterium BAL199]
MRGNDVVLSDVSMRFGDFTAVHPTDLTVREGEFFSILGPSGCGKTTILRMISGFLDPSSGGIAIGGVPMAGLGPNRRPTALIFQNLALFPLMTVWENVAFGLEARGVPIVERKRRASELLSLVALDDQGHKKPTELSGGQRQRVAVARALAVEPAVLLLDEPLSALDLKLRQHMRAELKDIQRRTGVTFIYITHDQGEALTMSDRIAVMNQGRVQQVGTGDEIYDRPATPFVATFVGEQNVFQGRVTATNDGQAVVDTAVGPLRGTSQGTLSIGDEALLFVRPERVSLMNGATASPDNRIDAEVERRDLEGSFVNLHLRAGNHPISVHLTNAGSGRDVVSGGQRVSFQADDAVVMRAGEFARE